MKSARAGATTSRVMFGTTPIEYAIGRLPRKTMAAIAIAAGAQTDSAVGRLPVQVPAPIDTLVATLDVIVLRTATGIGDTLRCLEDLLPPPSPRRTRTRPPPDFRRPTR